jgi:hypothetical protein
VQEALMIEQKNNESIVRILNQQMFLLRFSKTEESGIESPAKELEMSFCFRCRLHEYRGSQCKRVHYCRTVTLQKNTLNWAGNMK